MRWVLYGASAVILASIVVACVRQGSWTPLESMAWAPAVLVAVASSGGSCARRRRMGA